MALAEHHDQSAANAIRFLLLTGARRGETLQAKWFDINISEVLDEAGSHDETGNRASYSAIGSGSPNGG